MGRMVDQTGLNERLQQHARRSGMLVGLSMAVAIALIIGAFVWIFVRVDPLLSDFTGQNPPRIGTPAFGRVGSPVPVGGRPGLASTTPPPAPGDLPPPPTPTALAAASPAPPEPFVATHQIGDYGLQVNLRSGPSASAARILLLSPGARLKFLDEEERAGEIVWLKFETERGDVGWVRSLDVVPVR